MKEAACRTDLGRLTRKLLEQQQEIERLRAERDEARREVCQEIFTNGGLRPSEYATYRGWDCYKKDTP
jgi:predicted RNase H-like nuclease (RuvC/YqgF family)